MTVDRFRLVSRWQLDAPEDRVFAALADIGALSKWWPGLRVAAVRHSAEVVGREADIELRGLSVFRLRVRVRIESALPNRELRVSACGDLEGTGSWQLGPNDAGTEATFEWNVLLCHRWLRPLSRVLRPLFVASHAFAMRRGARGLNELLRSRKARAALGSTRYSSPSAAQRSAASKSV